MAKSTVSYFNALDPSNADKGEGVEGSDGILEQLTLAIDGDLYHDRRPL